LPSCPIQEVFTSLPLPASLFFPGGPTALWGEEAFHFKDWLLHKQGRWRQQSQISKSNFSPTPSFTKMQVCLRG
jgi:hypothetical protein